MQTNIIELISNSCSCSQTEAQEYLDSEIRNLRELQEVDDLREDDIEMACSNLGLDLDYHNILSIASLGAQKTYGYDLFPEHTLSSGLEEGVPPSGIAAPS